MNREELDQLTADTVAGEKLLAAKAAYRKDKSAANKRKLDEAKAAIQAVRAKQRGIRESLNPDATVPTVTSKAKAG